MRLEVKFCMINSVKSVRIQNYSGPYLPAFGLNAEELRIQSEYGKIQTGTTNTDTFYVVKSK